MKDINFSRVPVPASARKTAWSLSAVMLGLTFFSASMWAGGTLGAGLSFSEFFLAVAAGNLLLGVYTATLGYIGSRTGLSTHLLAHYSFGTKGSWLPSFLLGATQIGWFGVGVAMFAIPVSKATGWDTSLLIALSGALMTATVYFGIAGLTALSVIAVPAIALLGSYSVWLAIEHAGGFRALSQTVSAQPMPMETAIALVVGSFISAGTLTADFVRFGKSPRQAVVVCLIAFFAGNSLMFIFGAAGAAATGLADISDVMLLQGLIWPAVVVLGLNIWTTNDNALYASGLALSNITGLASRALSIVNGLAGTAMAMWLYHNFVGWLTFLSAAIPPVGGVIIADYLLRRRRYAEYPGKAAVVINVPAFVAVVAGLACGHLLPGIVPVNAVLGAMATYAFLLRR